jgi:hypothetical protein
MSLTCKGCKFANWAKTESGRLHRNGEGRCTYEVKIPRIPASKRWTSGSSVYGGSINRNRELPRDCPCFEKDE